MRLTRAIRRLLFNRRLQLATCIILIFCIVARVHWKEAGDGIITDHRPSCREQFAGEVAELCEHLRSLHRRGQPRGLIYYLAKGDRMGKLNESLAALDAHFNSQFRYPIVVFHDAKDASFSKSAVRNLTKSAVFFQKIELDLPPFINQSMLENGESCTRSFPVRYRHMCRFHSVLVYEQPIMQLPDVEYVLRLDDDSLIRRPIVYDIFDFVRQRRMRYAYILTDLEEQRCILGLSDTVENYIRNVSHVAPQVAVRWQPFRMFYNNFELSAMELWRSEAYRKYIRYVDEQGGIYYHRWGDAPIKTVAVRLFVPLNQTHHFADIAYHHQYREQL